MKAKQMMGLVAAAFLLPVFGTAQSAYEDDLYYTPTASRAETTDKSVDTQQPNDNKKESIRIHDQTGTLKSYRMRDVDEYNRRVPESEAEEHSTTAATDEERSFEYSERVRRFHDPKFTTHITDDEYVSIYVEDGADVDIYYTDGPYSSWMSPFYYDYYYYPRYGYRWNYGFGSYYDPWGYYGWGYDPWYSGYYWGWSYNPWPYYGYHHYYHSGWGHHHDFRRENRHDNHLLNARQRQFLSSERSGQSVRSKDAKNYNTRSSSTRSSNTRSSSRVNTESSSRREQHTPTYSNERDTRSNYEKKSTRKESPASSSGERNVRSNNSVNRNASGSHGTGTRSSSSPSGGSSRSGSGSGRSRR